MVSLFVVITYLFISYISKSNDHFHSSLLLAKQTNQDIRGILALLIVFAHFSHDYAFYFSSRGTPFGVVSVGLFFFFSGYGLMKQLVVKGKTYFDCFLSKRAKKLLPAFIITVVLAVFLSKITNIQILEMGGENRIYYIA